ncbi:hypothetical protein COT72_05305 [archaeon CG10_big_fil_rev_8_21_14_0_10_43_11]|nr:MAG: hypothetical protein COT72_05305 [archaeon CG10_big_fil_rev_8_21_14_0_10_43_11]
MVHRKRAEIFTDIKDVLEHVLHGIETQDSAEIKEWSNHIIHNASVFQDKYSVRTGILVYALSKIHERYKFEKNARMWERFWSEIITDIRLVVRSLEANDEKNIDKGYRLITRQINSADKKFSEHIQHVLEKAKVQKAWKVYEHGVSLGRVAELMGVSKWDAMQYLGQTRTSDYKEAVSEHIKQRFKQVKDVFKPRKVKP